MLSVWMFCDVYLRMSRGVRLALLLNGSHSNPWCMNKDVHYDNTKDPDLKLTSGYFVGNSHQDAKGFKSYVHRQFHAPGRGHHAR